MIKVTKDLNNIPTSLKPPIIPFFIPPALIPLESQTTHARRLDVIRNRKYTDHPTFNSRYKYKDIKLALDLVYKGKCAYCEQKVELTHVEHYRPKNIYHWIAFSWDNLLIACAHCNTHKGQNFELQGTKATFRKSTANIQNINILSSVYDVKEQPKMVNPEVTEPLGKIKFKKDGSIESDDLNFKYTIEKCKLSRTYLKEERKRLLDIFTRNIQSIFTQSGEENQLIEVGAIVKKFVLDTLDDREQFIAFRTYAINSHWLNDIIQEFN